MHGRPVVLCLSALLLLYLAGCFLVDGLVQAERPFAFSHHLHAEEADLDCTDCHGSVEDSDDPGMPRPAQCALCHAQLDAEKPPDLQVASLFEGQVFRAARAGHQADEVLFSHLSHATRGGECSDCHAEVAVDDGTLAKRGTALRMSMDACLACHDRGTGPREAECAACHREIRAGVAPPDHGASWTRYHGTVVRGRVDGRSDQCARCHEPADCTNCHHVQLPANHDNFWQRRGHGLTASMDRQSCATCHDPDSCQRCHEETRPQSHVASFGAPTDRHCLSCHEPLRATSCRVCHASTPSHELATPLPPDHLPSMDCRLCHGAGQPLPHEDNGQSCTSCHR